MTNTPLSFYVPLFLSGLLFPSFLPRIKFGFSFFSSSFSTFILIYLFTLLRLFPALFFHPHSPQPTHCLHTRVPSSTSRFQRFFFFTLLPRVPCSSLLPPPFSCSQVRCKFRTEGMRGCFMHVCVFVCSRVSVLERQREKLYMKASPSPHTALRWG